ncbi:hypothetical protein GNIT_3020 [Glaciecola nitratireducens FR1064]|uniref:Uncharacterized protein n=1 Tax=Glaciecola nitratireducens (strain JCM 12485 / KCTC 12276 / FR1064) TaxID=1085623 RepID=G4QDT8_GLANF|nr:hypothetical protein GNIT_3020 [Glaciecola nitratireducens FR1064]
MKIKVSIMALTTGFFVVCFRALKHASTKADGCTFLFTFYRPLSFLYPLTIDTKN